ncbi:uncharacterized protein L969DRAFT_42534 [Mixia osmundae IAM 14324]|uniref:C2 domain-containing protein n=1 Tax=Mixia osmundae (strain CBS 9802 / IAM 14324 / JCM 22182 / KY 12970) TaxID=764103 RepID=G7DTL5_MIXOS|nr:uncharacterized protein L969DRAFT_42534 [Mixia osmundae IAM 14324]KEI42801.1 hypothetical protein L969DRAFT_42534 [Mixia osmundae IAM 14324]GAA93862.1 hypothetical protein E5Q_00508 [Mixia osmundae IAM 14324]
MSGFQAQAVHYHHQQPASDFLTVGPSESPRRSVEVGTESTYEWALKIACLVHVLQAAADLAKQRDDAAAIAALNARPGLSAEKPLKSARPHSTGSRTDLNKSRSSVIEGNPSWANTFASLGDIFGSSKSALSASQARPVQFPKELIKALEKKIEAIAKGQDRTYTDLSLRATVGAFFGPYGRPAFQKTLKENRKVEEIILQFVTTAQGVLRKQATREGGGDEWKDQLMIQTATFVRIIQDVLKTIKSSSTELLARMETYVSKMVPKPAPATRVSVDGSGHLTVSASRQSGSTSSPTSTRAPSPSSSLSQQLSSTGSEDLHQQRLVRQVGRLFRIPPDKLRQDVDMLRPVITQESICKDLRAVIAQVHLGAHFPYCEEDFQDPDAFEHWRRKELDELSTLLESMQVAPSSPQTVKRPTLAGRTSSLSGRLSLTHLGKESEQDAEEARKTHRISAGDLREEATHSYTFIPTDTEFHYQHLLETCLNHDIEATHDLSPDDQISLRILSKDSQDLLEESAIWWRIMSSHCAVAFLDEICRRFASFEIPLIQCVGEAVSQVDAITAEWPQSRWAKADSLSLAHVLSELFDTILRRLCDSLRLPEASTDLDVIQTVELLAGITVLPAFAEGVDDLDIRLPEFEEAVRDIAARTYEDQRAQMPRLQNATLVEVFLRLFDWVRSSAAIVDKRFPSALLGSTDVAATYIDTLATSFGATLHQYASALSELPDASQEDADRYDSELRALYDGCLELRQMHRAFNPSTQLEIDFAGCFAPFVRRWLEKTDRKTISWVQSAISVDLFTAVGEDRRSSSVVDLIESCKSAADYLVRLKWPVEEEYALFLTRLTQTISKAVEQYCNKLEELFMEDLFPEESLTTPSENHASTAAWLIKAREHLQGDKRAVPFHFQPRSCVILNNIEAARGLLDTLYTTLDADRLVSLLERTQPTQVVRPAHTSYLFSVKVVLAEGLVAVNEAAKINPFLCLSDRHGNRLAKTRTLYDTANPRWGETVDLSIEGDLWVAATVYDRALVDDHDQIGRAYLHLDPDKFGDFLAHDLWLPLDTHGRALLRVNMEGEKDDIRFYFGRAFRSLKRAENDMVRIIVDKMSPFIRQLLSRQGLRTLVRKGYNFSDLKLDQIKLPENIKLENIKLDKVTAFFKSNGQAKLSEIPPVEIERAAAAQNDLSQSQAGRKRPAVLTDKEIEDVIEPLFEYFDESLAVLKENLSDTACHLVMVKLWKEILNIIESLLVPPLSDQLSEMKQLSDKEVYIVVKWLKGLANFLYGEGEGVPLEDLHNARYQHIISLPMYYEQDTDTLMEQCNRAVNQRLAQPSLARGLTRSKSVLQQRNLGTIRQRKQEKRKDHDAEDNADMLLRILRMRTQPGVAEFLARQFETINFVKTQQQQQVSQRISRPSARPKSSFTGLTGRGRTNRLTRPFNVETAHPSLNTLEEAPSSPYS